MFFAVIIMLAIPQVVFAEYGGEIKLNSGATRTVTLSSYWTEVMNAYGNHYGYIWDIQPGGTSGLVTTVRKKTKTSCEIVISGGKTGKATLRYWNLYTDKSNTTRTCEITWDIIVDGASVKVTNINLDKSQIELPSNNYEQLTATVSPSNATNKNVSWTSNNTNIATVSSTGLVYGVGAGTATITCKAADGSGVSATCKVIVTKEPTSISLPAEMLVGVGETVTLPYTLEPENASTSITWVSRNRSIATVSSSGEVTGVTEGTTTITATTANGKSASCKVTVSKDLVRPTKITLPYSCNVEVGYSTKMRYTLEPGNATTTITWKSSDTSIATVSSYGIVKGIKQGRAKITAITDNGLSDYDWVSVGGFKNGTQFEGTSSDDYDVTYKVTDINAKTCEVYDCNNSAKIVVIPSSTQGYKVTSVGQQAFGYTNIESITIPNSVTKISDYAFNNSQSLTKISGFSSVEYIGYLAFKDTPWPANLPEGTNYVVKVLYKYKGTMPNNTTVTIADGTTQIYSFAYSSLKGLYKVNLPSSIKIIDNYAFADCDMIIVINSSVTQPTAISKNAFHGDVYKYATLYVPIGTKGLYQSTEGWKNFNNIVEFDPTAIDEITVDEDDQQTIYSISGVRLKNPQKGLNIINGKKVVVK